MDAFGATTTKVFKPVSVRRNVERRILRFSLCVAGLCTLIAAFAYALALRSDLRDSEKANTEALSEMHCSGVTCDTSDFTTDW